MRAAVHSRGRVAFLRGCVSSMRKQGKTGGKSYPRSSKLDEARVMRWSERLFNDNWRGLPGHAYSIVRDFLWRCLWLDSMSLLSSTVHGRHQMNCLKRRTLLNFRNKSQVHLIGDNCGLF